MLRPFQACCRPNVPAWKQPLWGDAQHPLFHLWCQSRDRPVQVPSLAFPALDRHAVMVVLVLGKGRMEGCVVPVDGVCEVGFHVHAPCVLWDLSSESDRSWLREERYMSTAMIWEVCLGGCGKDNSSPHQRSGRSAFVTAGRSILFSIRDLGGLPWWLWEGHFNSASRIWEVCFEGCGEGTSIPASKISEVCLDIWHPSVALTLRKKHSGEHRAQ